MAKFNYLFISIGLIAIACAIYFRPVANIKTEVNPITQIKESKTIVQDLRSRDDDGICRDMYAEGFEWGLSQYPLMWQTEHWQYPDYMSKEAKAMDWYKTWEEIINNLN